MYEMDEHTVSLLHFEDGIKDETGRVWVSSNASVSTEQKKFGNSSLAVDVGKYIYTDDVSNFDFTGQFTIEMWAMFTKYPSKHINPIHSLFTQYMNLQNAIDLSVSAAGAESINVIEYDAKNGGAVLNQYANFNFSLNVWYHIAFVSNGSQNYIFVNGEKILDTPIIKKLPLLNTTRACIGKFFYPSYEYDCIGYIDDFRISNIARWTSDFTLPGTISAPINLVATAADSKVTLSWTAVDDATGYNVKRSTTAGGPYTTIATNVPSTSYLDTTVTNGTTYYYVVTAVDGNCNESANSNEASATPQAPSGHGLLRITMNDSSEREYQLSDDEINKFIEWCDRTVGTGNSLYVFDKTYNVGEFKTRKEYLLFEKIISFEVMELTK
jgi:hypothetical protein